MSVGGAIRIGAVIVGLGATGAGAASGPGETKAEASPGAIEIRTIGASLFPNDVVRTGPSGKATVELFDGSKIEIGPNASAKLESLVVPSDGAPSQATIRLTKGLFKFVVTEKRTEDVYTILTPHGTITIQGGLISRSK